MMDTLPKTMKDRELTMCLGLPRWTALFKQFLLIQLQTLLLKSLGDISLNLQF